MNIPSWAVTVGLVVIIICTAAWIFSQRTEKTERQDADEDKSDS